MSDTHNSIQTIRCNACNQTFKTASTLRSHRYNNKNGKCKKLLEQKTVKARASELIDQMNPEEIIDAVENKKKNEDMQKEMQKDMQNLNQKMNTLIEQNEYQKRQMSCIEKQNNEMKDMMLEFNKNPQLVIL